MTKEEKIPKDKQKGEKPKIVRYIKGKGSIKI
jgi:hypothetical protein